MHLTITEEQELVHWITTQCGYAPRYRTVCELAEIIRNRRVCSVNDDDVHLVNYDKFSKNWVPRFISRYLHLYMLDGSALRRPELRMCQWNG